MNSCPLVTNTAPATLPRFEGRAIATVLAFGMGVMLSVVISVA